MDVLSEECGRLRRPGGFEVCIIAGQSDFSARPLNDFIREVLDLNFRDFQALKFKKKKQKKTPPRKTACVSLQAHACSRGARFCFLFGLLRSSEELLQASKWPDDMNTLTQKTHLQWTIMGPASGGLQAFTRRRKARKGVGCSGTP